MYRSSVSVACVVSVLLAACSGGDGSPTEASTPVGGTESTRTADSVVGEAADGDGCADVVGVTTTATDAGDYRFDVMVSSPDTGWDKYADGWEVRSPSGTVLGFRELTHPHVDEQPFTRSLSGVEIPDDVEFVTVAARDSVEGFCGEEMTVAVE